MGVHLLLLVRFEIARWVPFRELRRAVSLPTESPRAYLTSSVRFGHAKIETQPKGP